MFENETNHTSDQDILAQNRSSGLTQTKTNRESALIDCSDLKADSNVEGVEQIAGFKYQAGDDELDAIDQKEERDQIGLGCAENLQNTQHSTSVMQRMDGGANDTTMRTEQTFVLQGEKAIFEATPQRVHIDSSTDV